VKHTKKAAAMMVALVMTALSFTSCSSLLPTEEDIMPPPISQPEATDYSTVEVALGDIQEEKTCVGAFTSTELETMSFQLDSGTFYQYYVKKGETVKKGDVLAEAENTSIAEQVEALEESIYRNKLQNDYSLARLQQGLKSSQKSLTKQKDSLTEAKKELTSQESKLTALGNDLLKKKALTAGADYTQDEINALIDEAQKAYDDQAAQVSAQKSSISGMTEEIERATEDLALEQQNYDMQKTFIDMEVQKNQEALTEFQTQLKETQIIAPFDGKITFLASLVIGDQINKDIPILTIANPDTLQFQYILKDNDDGDLADALFAGREVTIAMNDGTRMAGVILQGPANVPNGVERDEDQRTTYVEVKEIPENVTIGSVGSMQIILKEEHDVIVVESALISKINGRNGETAGSCYVLQDGLPVLRNVQTGLETTAYIQIVDGLEVGEKLITNFK